MFDIDNTQQKVVFSANDAVQCVLRTEWPQKFFSHELNAVNFIIISIPSPLTLSFQA